MWESQFWGRTSYCAALDLVFLRRVSLLFFCFSSGPIIKLGLTSNTVVSSSVHSRDDGGALFWSPPTFKGLGGLGQNHVLSGSSSGSPSSWTFSVQVVVTIIIIVVVVIVVIVVVVVVVKHRARA